VAPIQDEKSRKKNYGDRKAFTLKGKDLEVLDAQAFLL
jgi:hypothetical protein